MFRYDVKIIIPDSVPSVNWGSVMHGILIEQLPAEWQEALHNDQLRPLSQWVEPIDVTSFVWHLSVLDDTLAGIISSFLQPGKEFPCKHVQSIMKISDIQTKSTTITEYMKPFYLAEEPCAGIYLNFHTTTTHKSQGRYAVFPSVELIGKSLRNHFCSLEPSFVLADDEILGQILDHTRIARYNLQSSYYSLEGGRIDGYTGHLLLRFDGPDPLKRLAGTLFSFAEWTGVGIKTALGMGACTVAPFQPKKKTTANQ